MEGKIGREGGKGVEGRERGKVAQLLIVAASTKGEKERSFRVWSALKMWRGGMTVLHGGGGGEGTGK